MPLNFDAAVCEIGDELEIDATTTVDHRLLDMTWSPLSTLRPSDAARQSATHMTSETETDAPHLAPGGQACG